MKLKKKGIKKDPLEYLSESDIGMSLETIFNLKEEISFLFRKESGEAITINEKG